jgi:hypothetical protein
MSIYALRDLFLQYNLATISLTGTSDNGKQFCTLTSFVFMWILQMDALVFGENELTVFIPKPSFNVTAVVVVVVS